MRRSSYFNSSPLSDIAHQYKDSKGSKVRGLPFTSNREAAARIHYNVNVNKILIFYGGNQWNSKT